MKEESKKTATVADRWFEERMESGFRRIGMDRAQGRFIMLMADLERLCDYYRAHRPDAEGRRELMLTVRFHLDRLYSDS